MVIGLSFQTYILLLIYEDPMIVCQFCISYKITGWTKLKIVPHYSRGTQAMQGEFFFHLDKNIFMIHIDIDKYTDKACVHNL